MAKQKKQEEKKKPVEKSKEDEKREGFQKKYMDLQMLDQQIKQIQKQLEVMETQIAELDYVKESLKDLENVKPETEFFAPISSGVFIKAELKKNDSVLVNVGADTAVMKSIPETMETIDEQSAEIIKYRDHVVVQMQKMIERAQEIQREIQSEMKKG